jgi:hypothetical protein
MKTYTISMAQTMTHVPEHPERTAYRTRSGLDFDYTYRVWPSRAAMLKTIQMQSRREPRSDDWRDWLVSRMAEKLGVVSVETLPGGSRVVTLVADPSVRAIAGFADYRDRPAYRAAILDGLDGAEPPERILVAHIDLERWYDIYEGMPEKDQDVVKDTHIGPRGDSMPMLECLPHAAALARVLEKHQLGAVEDITSQYVFYVTNAPEAYDGFSTLPIGTTPVPEKYTGTRAAKDTWRIVAIMPRDVEWQTMRYHSGLYPSEKIWP